VHRAAARELERCGFRTDPRAEPPSGFIHSTGHGVGLEVHEAPSVSAGQGPLKLGHVVTIEPGLYYPGVGGVRVEDTVVLVPGGFDRLASCPVFLEIP
jgi:Xaa-Pro aminopeptidase